MFGGLLAHPTTGQMSDRPRPDRELLPQCFSRWSEYCLVSRLGPFEGLCPTHSSPLSAHVERSLLQAARVASLRWSWRTSGA